MLEVALVAKVGNIAIDLAYPEIKPHTHNFKQNPLNQLAICIESYANLDQNESLLNSVALLNEG